MADRAKPWEVARRGLPYSNYCRRYIHWLCRGKREKGRGGPACECICHTEAGAGSSDRALSR